MPTAMASRVALRQSRLLLRRNNIRQASTAAETANKAKEAVSETTSKASEGLTRVSSSAGSAISNAGSGARNALGRIGGRTGRLIQRVESLIPPTIYYARVGLELSKIMFQGQKMTPPNLTTFSTYFQPLTNAVRNPRSLTSGTSSMPSPEGVLSSVRNVNRQQVVVVACTAAEILGFFTVGTMIGRMKVVGYHGQPTHAH